MEKRVNMDQKTVRLLASLGLLLATVVWGSTFVVMKNSMDVITPSWLLAFRSVIASVGLVLIFWKQVKTMTWLDVRCGAVLGVLLFISYYFQTYGLKYTTASKNAFITTLYVIIVPFLHWFFNRVKPLKNNVIAGLIAVAGLALLSLKGDMTVNLGDVLTFICGFFFALHLVFMDRYTSFCSTVKLTLMQMISAGVCFFIMAVLFEGPLEPGIFKDRGLLLSILYLGFVGSMLCYLLQTAGQTHLSPSTSAILLSFESVFGLIFSVLFLKEIVTFRMLAGGALMFAAAILSECAPSKKKVENVEHRVERDMDGEIIIHS